MIANDVADLRAARKQGRQYLAWMRSARKTAEPPCPQCGVCLRHTVVVDCMRMIAAKGYCGVCANDKGRSGDMATLLLMLRKLRTLTAQLRLARVSQLADLARDIDDLSEQILRGMLWPKIESKRSSPKSATR